MAAVDGAWRTAGNSTASKTVLDEPPAMFANDRVHSQAGRLGTVVAARRVTGGDGPHWAYLVHYDEGDFRDRSVGPERLRVATDLCDYTELAPQSVAVYTTKDDDHLLVQVQHVNFYSDGSHDFFVRQLHRVLRANLRRTDEPW
mmetsp:Transcript_39712/g.97309  ORF Transcript_39712/g.97309 Transcript_39712/m.97309 type:complete len:144 (-) Transcript_39712:85-516(-)